jgi:hypothetical protein
MYKISRVETTHLVLYLGKWVDERETGFNCRWGAEILVFFITLRPALGLQAIYPLEF